MNPIRNHDGRPFETIESAMNLRDLLVRETGFVYRIDRSSDGEGFVLVRTDARDPNVRPSDRDANSDPDRDAGRRARAEPRDSSEHKPLIVRPALRADILLYLPIVSLGVACALSPEGLLWALFSAFGVSSLPTWVRVDLLPIGLRWLGWLFLLWPACAIFLPWLSSRYIVSAEGISAQRGIIARDVVQIRYRDILSIGLKQGILDRLLNVGTVEFDTAGSAGIDQVDIAFVGIPRPARIRDLVRGIMETNGEAR